MFIKNLNQKVEPDHGYQKSESEKGSLAYYQTIQNLVEAMPSIFNHSHY